MKKIWITILIVLLVLVVLFRPQKIDKGGGMLPVQYYNECQGLYFETYNDTPVDGTRGGWCFGKIKEYKYIGMPLGANPSNPEELAKVPILIIPPELTLQKATELVVKNWGEYVSGEGTSFDVSVKNNYDSNFTYTITAIYGQADDSINKVKKEAIAMYQNGEWILRQATITHSCWPGRGHTDFNTTPCL